MNISSRSMWHGGGTSAPLRRARRGSLAGIRVEGATGVVPLRAIGSTSGGEKAPVKPEFMWSAGACGTEWQRRSA